GVRELERERQALDLVLLDLLLQAAALGNERTTQVDGRLGGGALERDHELAALDRDRLDLGTGNPEALDQRRGRAVLAALTVRAALVADERRVREPEPARGADRARRELRATLAAGDVELQLRMTAGQAAGRAGGGR